MSQAVAFVMPTSLNDNAVEGKSSQELLCEHRMLSREVEADLKALKRRSAPPSFWAETLQLLGLRRKK